MGQARALAQPSFFTQDGEVEATKVLLLGQLCSKGYKHTVSELPLGQWEIRSEMG